MTDETEVVEEQIKELEWQQTSGNQGKIVIDFKKDNQPVSEEEAKAMLQYVTITTDFSNQDDNNVENVFTVGEIDQETRSFIVSENTEGLIGSGTIIVKYQKDTVVAEARYRINITPGV